MTEVEILRQFIHHGPECTYRKDIQAVLDHLGCELSYDPLGRKWSTSVPYEYSSIYNLRDHGESSEFQKIPQEICHLWFGDRRYLCKLILENASFLREAPARPTFWEHLDEEP